MMFLKRVKWAIFSAVLLARHGRGVRKLLAFSMQRENVNQFNGYRRQVFPAQPTDSSKQGKNLFTFSATTTIRPNLLNEFRAGLNYFQAGYTGLFYPNESSVLPHIGAQPFFLNFLMSAPMTGFVGDRAYRANSNMRRPRVALAGAFGNIRCDMSKTLQSSWWIA